MDYVSRALDFVAEWRDAAGPLPSHPALEPDPARLDAAWAEFGERMAVTYPFHHPRYAGQMLKPPHPVAIAAYTAAIHVNGNNHALDSSPATSAMEVEVIGELTRMFGLPEETLGPPDVERHDRQPRGAVGGARAAPGQGDRLQGRRPLHARAHVRRDRGRGHPRRRPRGGLPLGTGRDDRRHRRHDRARHRRRHRGGAAAARGLRRPRARRRRLRRLLRAARRARPGGVVPRHRRLRQRRHRPAQARPAALRLRRRAVPRPRRRAAVQARLALHVLHVRRAAPGRDLARVLARRRVRRGAVDDAARARPEADPERRGARRPRLGGAAAGLG